MKIYTKTGDTGETSLVGGTRVSKADVRLETYGDVDELNSHLGVLFSDFKNNKKYAEELDVLEKTQNALFTLGSNLACAKEQREKYKLPELKEEDVARLERKIDEYESELSPLKNFILPNGSCLAAKVHLARAVCRRVERKLTAFTIKYPGEEPENSVKLLNRLSDFLFVLARRVNKEEGERETIWKG
ncbi:MAG: cob(I)yrinic acid a,c-diamide adenosyltransferase [Bacteriovoracaceae bacterium]